MADKIKARIEKLSKEDLLSNWESSFLDSLVQWVDKGRGLSHKQNTTLQNIEAKYSEDKKAALNAWKEGFTPEMHENLVIMAHYYINNPPYFRDLAVKPCRKSLIFQRKRHIVPCAKTNMQPA